MLQRYSALFFGATLFSAAVHAMGQEQQWCNWSGVINVMEFELSADNSAGERVTLTCRDSRLIVDYSVPEKEYRDTTDDGLKEVGLNINGTHFQPGEAAFMALKNTNGDGKIEITRMNKPLSHPFKTTGLHDALQDITWEDCTSH
ncbi:hypothetical protein [Cronobacter sakazakii]|uniref:hypothetical protein n=1 Tax=Cronobacter sakazakii TaxID=28141 RepID=UPI000CFCBE15|nr:hypothetical protein [Cronobacter sakazakii]UWT88256.1 hypothetical protein N1710_04580 [Cronobacter sakazakii]